MSLRGKQWIWPEQNEELTSILARNLKLNPALAQLLINRGITDPGQARAFLCPSREDFHSPWLMKGMKEAVYRLFKALEKNEKIVIHGDYDADGITAAVILVEALNKLGAAVDYYLPSRFGEGYGLHLEPLKQFIANGADLVVTVDCGINAVEEAAYASAQGLDMIITDHHQPLQRLPGVIAALNPLQEDCPYPYKELSGAGIAFKLASALMDYSGRPLPEDLLDLTALGTAADVVPLLDENRAIVHCGLEILRSRQRPGFKALMEAVSLDQERISSGSLSFILAPAVNAVGRMGEAMPAARLFLEKDAEKAEALALRLHDANRLRRATEQNILLEAETAAEELLTEKDQKIITLSGENWHHGVIGIVASRLVEKYNRPTCLVALEDNEGRGSARSIPGFDITAALAECSKLLERFGGHDQAAGFSIQPERVEELRECLNNYAEKNLEAGKLFPTLNIDAELEPSELRSELVEQIEKLQPFGTANPAPLFGSRNWELKAWRLVGSEQKHLKLSLQQNGRFLAPIVFSGAYLEPQLEKDRPVDLALKLKKGFYREQETLEVEVKDIKYSDTYYDGKLNLIDWRNCQNRYGRAKEIIEKHGEKAVIFTSTTKRAKKLWEYCTSGSLSVFVTSGALNGEKPIPRGSGPVVFFDLPLYEGLLKHILKEPMLNENLTVYLLYSKKDQERNNYLLDLSLPSESQLQTILDYLEQNNERQITSLFSKSIKDKLNPHAGPTFWQRVADIFDEAGLFDGGIIKKNLSEAKNNWPSCIAPSSTYIATSNRRKDCEQFQNTLLKASPEDIFCLIKELTVDK
ncbi:MAG: single-stranded-DNA-specific exonuclease RecJ [Bacillota bacterium]